MKNSNIKVKVLALALSLGVFTSCEQENENIFLDEENLKLEEVNEVDFQARQGRDCQTNDLNFVIPNVYSDKNAGISKFVDDRSCSYDYGQSGNFGVYQLNSGNRNGSLQTRIERTTGTIGYSNGASLTVSGTVKILNSGIKNMSSSPYAPSDMRDENGTYIAQVKGKHTGGGGSPDPAIMLFIAKPARYNRGSINNGGAVWLDSSGYPGMYHIYAELIRKRGGSGPNGRRLIYITSVYRDSEFSFNVTSRFTSNNNHYIDYNINGSSNSHKISRQTVNGHPSNPVDTKIRMGAYRCKGGYADIRWKNNLWTNKPKNR
ncbi:hypothetical protein OBPA_20460 [Polaribacter sp. OB-PA-B3]